MSDITIDISGIRFDDFDLADKIDSAIKNNQMFALKSKWSIMLYNPEKLYGKYVGHDKYGNANFAYADINQMLNAIAVALITHRQFMILPPNLVRIEKAIFRMLENKN